MATSSASASLLLLSARCCAAYPSPNPNPSLSFPLSAPPPFPSLALRHRTAAACVASSAADVAQPETIEPPAETLDEDENVYEDEQSELPSPSAIISEDDASKLSSSPEDVSSISPQKLVLRNSYGESLVGLLHEVGSSRIVILCHGFRSSKDSKMISHLADALANENISVCRFDFSGNGESEGTFEYGGYRKEVEDLRAVIMYFRSLKREVHAILGHSKGGNVVLLYSSKYGDVANVISVAGRFDLKSGIEGRLGKNYIERIGQFGFIDVEHKRTKTMYRVTKESLMDRLSTDMVSACKSIDHNCRVLTIHGTADSTVPSSDALEFDKCISNHKVHIIEGADHSFSSHLLELANAVLNFVRSA